MDRSKQTVSVIGLGTWQLGADWGEVTEQDALQVLEAAYEHGVRFFDTADVYGDGRSEQIVGRFRKDHPDITVATKMGRRLPQEPENYSMVNFEQWTDRSRKNLAMDTLDLVQLHCPPTAVCGDDRVFEDLDTLVEQGRIAAYGLSVETSAQALMAIDRPNVASVQIILNAFRRKPLAQVLPAAIQAGVGIIARVPLASGLLSGRYRHDTSFPDNDHRNYNRDGSAFDVGETFSGVPYDVGVDAAMQFSALAPEGVTPAQLALAWVIQQPGVSTVIPGARNRQQAEANAAAADIAALPAETLAEIEDIYDESISVHVASRW